ncbi:MAG: sigma-70 family RNA polymerase sigma factor [Ruminococcus flavefaciens]|nr:sigma-70 family RNA polymerase sigma factor [Ruminococcus flavefaciens]MCM1229663.1 sigma-70 family RNA polymerase sigma factor [Ruminococcus flavefaciens]
MKIEKEYDNIFRYALYHTGNKEDAEDITQEAFLKYLEHTEYHQKGNERQILYTIARNLCINLYRRNKPDSLDEEVNSGENVAEKVALRLAMEKLSDEEREIIILRLVNDENISVIAKLFNTSRFTMSRRINNIIKKLKNELKGE